MSNVACSRSISRRSTAFCWPVYFTHAFMRSASLSLSRIFTTCSRTKVGSEYMALSEKKKAARICGLKRSRSPRNERGGNKNLPGNFSRKTPAGKHAEGGNAWRGNSCGALLLFGKAQDFESGNIAPGNFLYFKGAIRRNALFEPLSDGLASDAKSAPRLAVRAEFLD
jgi:hypothetical protein